MFKFIKALCGIFFIPLAFGIFKEFIVIISSLGTSVDLFHILERGALAYFLVHIVLGKPKYVYVLGHEMVHAFAAMICGAKVLSFQVNSQGGRVITSKTNLFIELSPYFIPVYTVFTVFLFFVIKIFLGK